MDITAGYKVPAGAGGTLDLNAGFNYTRNKIIHVDPLPQVLIDADSTEPGCSTRSPPSASRTSGPTGAARSRRTTPSAASPRSGRLSYFGGFSSAQPGFCDLCRENYGGKGLVDAEIGYRFNLIKLSVGVRNLFDVYPDQPSSRSVVDDAGDTSKDFNDNFGTFPWAAASPFGYNGRFVYARTELQLLVRGKAGGRGRTESADGPEAPTSPCHRSERGSPGFDPIVLFAGACANAPSFLERRHQHPSASCTRHGKIPHPKSTTLHVRFVRSHRHRWRPQRSRDGRVCRPSRAQGAACSSGARCWAARA